MFEKPVDRILWPIAWLFLAPMITLSVWHVALAVLPLPNAALGVLVLAAMLVAACSVPVLVLRKARQQDHTIGAVLGLISLCWSGLTTLGMALYMAAVPVATVMTIH